MRVPLRRRVHVVIASVVAVVLVVVYLLCFTVPSWAHGCHESPKRAIHSWRTEGGETR